MKNTLCLNKKFPKAERLLKNQEFLKAQKLGKRLHTKNFVLVAFQKPAFLKDAAQKDTAAKSEAKTHAKPKAKLGITITTKVERSAVKRNRVKRIVREAFREIKANCTSGLNLVVIAKIGSTELTMLETKRQISSALRHNNLLSAV